MNVAVRLVQDETVKTSDSVERKTEKHHTPFLLVESAPPQPISK